MKKLALWPLLFFLLSAFLVFPSVISAIETPVLTTPKTGETINNPTLQWEWAGTCVSPPASCYLVQLNDHDDFSNPSRDPHYTSNKHYNPQLSNGVWYWQVKAKDSTGTWSPWSQIGSFTVDQSISPSSPPPANPSSPAIPVQPKNISLSEFMPNPSKGNEWVEIYNGDESVANLGGWKIDDGPEGSSPSSLGDSFLIEPKSLALFWFNSKLNNDGDTLRLLRPDGTEVEVVNFGKTTKDVSFAKDSKGTWRETLTSTPGQVNLINTGEVLATAENKVSEEDSSPSEELNEAAAEVVRSFSATSSSHSSKPIDTKKSSSSKTSSSIFLPVIFVGSGMILLIVAALIYLIKIGVIKKVPFRKARAPEEDKSSPSA